MLKLKLLWWYLKSTCYTFLIIPLIIIAMYVFSLLNHSYIIPEYMNPTFYKINIVVYFLITILAFFLITYRKVNGLSDLLRPAGVGGRDIFISSLLFLFAVSLSLLMPAYAIIYRTLTGYYHFTIPAITYFLNATIMIFLNTLGIAGYFKLLERTRLSIIFPIILLSIIYFLPIIYIKKYFLILLFPYTNSVANLAFFLMHSYKAVVPYFWGILGVIAWLRD